MGTEKQRRRIAVLERRRDWLAYRLATGSGTKGAMERCEAELDALDWVLKKLLSLCPDIKPDGSERRSVPLLRVVPGGLAE